MIRVHEQLRMPQWVPDPRQDRNGVLDVNRSSAAESHVNVDIQDAVRLEVVEGVLNPHPFRTDVNPSVFLHSTDLAIEDIYK